MPPLGFLPGWPAMAPPTLFTEPDLASPTANTPGTFDSSSSGCRPFPRASAVAACGPDGTNPLASSPTPQARSQLVAGSAPMNKKTFRIAPVLFPPLSKYDASAPVRAAQPGCP
jgi:hypothetical protein